MSILPPTGDRVSLKSLIPLLPSGIQQRIRLTHYSSKLKSARISDETDLGVIEHLVSSGDTVMDVGASFGLFTRFLADKVGSNGSVYAFEPTGVMSQVLEHSVTVLGLANVIISNQALSDKTGKASIAIPMNDDQTPNYGEASLTEILEEQSAEREEIERTTLDSFCDEKEVDDLTFLKLDVAGHEIEVLNGARITLEKFRPTILLAVNEDLDSPGHGSRVRDLAGYLGYGINVFELGKIRKREHGERFANYVLLPED
ncbi:MAG: FkbM family methyltransferase [Verrucomicrobiota bacterium]